jgi:lysophospholipase L1-like esterase
MYNRAPYDPEQPGGMNVLMPAVCDVVRRVAREEGVELVDVEAAFFEDAKKRGGEIDQLLLDGMHPNDGGHRLIADSLRERILAVAKRERLAIERVP